MRTLESRFLRVENGIPQVLSHLLGADANRAAEGRFGDSDLNLVGKGISSNLPGDELDRNHQALATVVLRGARADSLGANSATGRVVDGFRAGTG